MARVALAAHLVELCEADGAAFKVSAAEEHVVIMHWHRARLLVVERPRVEGSEQLTGVALSIWEG